MFENYEPKHRGESKPTTHVPNSDGSCSLLCTCTTPLSEEESRILAELGIF